MSRINMARVILAGLAAGVVMNVIEGVTNGVVLAAKWQAESDALNLRLMQHANASTIGWITVDFLLGILLVWVYAAARPRFGPGPSTAMKVSVVVWLISHLPLASYAFGGYHSPGLIGTVAFAGLVAMVVGGAVGAMVYRE